MNIVCCVPLYLGYKTSDCLGCSAPSLTRTELWGWERVGLWEEGRKKERKKERKLPDPGLGLSLPSFWAGAMTAWRTMLHFVREPIVTVPLGPRLGLDGLQRGPDQHRRVEWCSTEREEEVITIRL
jgi:hypothetical protein